MSQFLSESLDKLHVIDDDSTSVSSTLETTSMSPTPAIASPQLNKASSHSSSQILQSSTDRGKKKVTFAADTIIKEEETIASSVTSHQYVRSIGHTQYKVELIFRGIHWSIVKRYRDFETFHRQLIHGLPDDELSIVPELPKKRWFEKQRWINRFDDTYSRNRRFALQDYLRMVIRTFPFRQNQGVFVEFLEIPTEALDQDDRENCDEYSRNQHTRNQDAIESTTHSTSSNGSRDTLQPNEDSQEDEDGSSDEEQPHMHSWRDMEHAVVADELDEGETGDNSPQKKIVLSEEADSDDEEN